MIAPYYGEGHKNTKAFEGEGNEITFHVIHVQISNFHNSSVLIFNMFSRGIPPHPYNHTPTTPNPQNLRKIIPSDDYNK